MLQINVDIQNKNGKVDQRLNLRPSPKFHVLLKTNRINVRVLSSLKTIGN